MILSPLTREQVEEQKLPRFSHSRMNTYNRCLYKGYLIYEREIRPDFPPSNAMKKGTLIHRMLELDYRGPLNEEQILEQVQEEFPTYDYQILIFEAFALYIRYKQCYPKEPFSPVEMESELFVPYLTPAGNKVALHIIIDLVAEGPAGLIVMDTKTSGRPSWDGNSVWFDSQLLFYMAGLYLLGYDPKVGIINQINTSKAWNRLSTTPDHELFSRVMMKPSEASIKGSLKEIGHRIDQILALKIHPKNMNKDCARFCAFSDVCQMEIQGIDSEPLLKQLVINKESEEEFEFEFDV